MKPLGKIDFGDFYWGPWQWIEKYDAYGRYLFRKDGIISSVEEKDRFLKQLGATTANVPGESEDGYLGFAEFDRYFLELSERFSKLQAFQ